MGFTLCANDARGLVGLSSNPCRVPPCEHVDRLGRPGQGRVPILGAVHGLSTRRELLAVWAPPFFAWLHDQTLLAERQS